MSYTPPEKILNRYAELLAGFGLRKCKGMQKGDVVAISVRESARPMLQPLRDAVLRRGGFPIIRYFPDGMDKSFYDLATDEQLKFSPNKYLKGYVDQIDGMIIIDSDADPKELEGVPSDKLIKTAEAGQKYWEWRDKKEREGKFSWTLALYGTPAMAKEAGMSIEDYWGEIINACYLNNKSPIEKWREIDQENRRVRTALTKMPIAKLHVQAKNIDFSVEMGPNRKWSGGEGCNLPSFEIFTSPDCRTAEGEITFTEPLYHNGSLIKDVYLKFKNGRVVDYKASCGASALESIVGAKNGDRVGEFSLTDRRASKIKRFMATTLFDENVGGRQGNMHIALGSSYPETYNGDVSKMSKKEMENVGFNFSAVHVDIITTEKRTVTAILRDGTEIIIYRDGKFLV